MPALLLLAGLGLAALLLARGAKAETPLDVPVLKSQVIALGDRVQIQGISPLSPTNPIGFTVQDPTGALGVLGVFDYQVVREGAFRVVAGLEGVEFLASAKPPPRHVAIVRGSPLRVSWTSLQSLPVATSPPVVSRGPSVWGEI